MGTCSYTSFTDTCKGNNFTVTQFKSHGWISQLEYTIQLTSVNGNFYETIFLLFHLLLEVTLMIYNTFVCLISFSCFSKLKVKSHSSSLKPFHCHALSWYNSYKLPADIWCLCALSSIQSWLVGTSSCPFYRTFEDSIVSLDLLDYPAHLRLWHCLATNMEKHGCPPSGCFGPQSLGDRWLTDLITQMCCHTPHWSLHIFVFLAMGFQMYVPLALRKGCSSFQYSEEWVASSDGTHSLLQRNKSVSQEFDKRDNRKRTTR